MAFDPCEQATPRVTLTGYVSVDGIPKSNMPVTVHDPSGKEIASATSFRSLYQVTAPMGKMPASSRLV